jgi:hypothetical protein
LSTCAHGLLRRWRRLKLLVGERRGAATLLHDRFKISHIRVRRRNPLVSQNVPKKLSMVTIGTRSAYAHLGARQRSTPLPQKVEWQNSMSGLQRELDVINIADTPGGISLPQLVRYNPLRHHGGVWGPLGLVRMLPQTYSVVLT